jgi:hypothetical protein
MTAWLSKKTQPPEKLDPMDFRNWLPQPQEEEIGYCCLCNKVLGGSMEQTHQFEYIELHVEINLSIPRRIGV